ncbi:Holliday junction ATP-dependent DNA helicase RuvA [Candidatus Haliotispira prima]|uniref:Holliday junction branch migration complex subunit RuvA n=1 Tax=Candidatus Haliotispira prima TaxID=3034016 RepID=A0ABY8MJT8_9SPIO|nr:Holliday junction ATP-dependent DNA helicase RuvA [Candidatus Haliotispira prima]
MTTTEGFGTLERFRNIEDRSDIPLNIMVLNSIKGILTEKQVSGYACCEVNGVEWLLAMSDQSLAWLPGIGAEVRIYTQLKVSENSIALYGFAGRAERSLFEALISVPGIGPKVALAMLSKAGTEDIAACIIQGDVKGLSRLPGLGSKTAQKLILQLGDKLEKQLLLAGSSLSAASGSEAGKEPTVGTPGLKGVGLHDYLRRRQEYRDLLSALVSMGYEEKRSGDVLDELFAMWQEDGQAGEESDLPSEGERLRQAIVRLGTWHTSGNSVV